MDYKVRATVTLTVETTVDADSFEEAEDTVDGWDFSDYGFDVDAADIDIDWEVVNEGD